MLQISGWNRYKYTLGLTLANIRIMVKNILFHYSYLFCCLVFDIVLTYPGLYEMYKIIYSMWYSYSLLLQFTVC